MDLSLLLKVTLALVVGLAAAVAAGRARASVRHLFIAATFLVLLALPAAAVVVPVVPVTVSKSPRVAAAFQAVQRPIVSVTPAAALKPFQSQAPEAGRLTFSAATMLRNIWIGGMVLFFVPFVMSLVKIRRLRITSLPWSRGRERLRAMVPPGLNDIEVLQHDGIAAPLTCGLLNPVIIVPLDAENWSDASLERAFIHELEHIRRGDWLVQMAARVVCAVYWFHPLVWIAWRRLCVECERACDDAVIEHGERADYAEQLVTLARRVSVAPLEPMLLMAGRTDLSVRVRAILDPSQLRGRAGMAAVGLAIVVAVAFVAAVSPLQAQVRRPQIREARVRQAQAGQPAPPQLDAFTAAVADSFIGAADAGRIESVRTLLDRGADPNVIVPGDGTPLLVAARGGHEATVRLLLERGANPNIPVAGDGNPLIMAAREGHLSIVQLLLDQGARVDDIVPGDESALINASGRGQLAIVRLLVSRGADVNLGAWAGPSFDRSGDEWRTPLNMAERFGHSDVAQFLRQQGATR